MPKFANILETVGNTPVVRIGRLAPRDVNLYVKVEAFNPLERLDYFVTGFGTGGTLKGVGRVLAKERPEVKIVVSEPADAPLLTSGTAQERNADGSPAARHPAWKPHPIQGWSPDF